MVIPDTLGGSFLDVFFLLLAAILSELYEKPRRNKDSVTEKLHRRICLRDITTFLTTRPPFYVIC